MVEAIYGVIQFIKMIYIKPLKKIIKTALHIRTLFVLAILNIVIYELCIHGVTPFNRLASHTYLGVSSEESWSGIQLWDLLTVATASWIGVVFIVYVLYTLVSH